MESKNRKQKEFQLCDVLIEVLEVAINLILYIRNIYPDGIFQRQRKYNISVMMSQHRDVNSYIKDVLETIRSYIAKGEVEKIAVQITNKDDIPLERFCFEMKLLADNSQCYYDMETHLRAVLLKLNACESMLKPLPSDCTFQVLAYTKQSSLQHMEEQRNFQDFPWVVVENKSKESLTDPMIIPIRSCNTDALVLQCYVEENSAKDGM